MSTRYRIAPVTTELPDVLPGTVSFVIPAYQAVGSLAATVESVRAAAPEGSEVVIVDDGSSDDTPALAARLADRLVLRPCQGGAARARNDGARVARGDVLVFVDSDVTVTSQAVEGLLAAVRGGADAAFGAYEALPPERIRNAATTYKNLVHHWTHVQAAGAASTFWSGFGAVKRDAFWSVGGFDTASTTGADVEDIHLGYRLTAAGRSIVLDPSLQVTHHKAYTVRGVVVSDVVHRAIPWTRAMLQLGSYSPDLNLRRAAIAASVLAYTAVTAPLAVPVVGRRALAVGAAAGVGWAWCNRSFLGYARRTWSASGALRCAGFLGLYSLYCPPGAALGWGAHVLRRRRSASLNWLGLEPVDSDESDDGVEVTVAVIAACGEPLEALRGLPPVEQWWELTVVSDLPRSDVPDGVRHIVGWAGAERDELRQLALDVAAGGMFATLDAGCVPQPGWLDRVRASARGSDLVVAGAFEQDRRGVRARAEQVSRYWQWRPERRAGWSSHHPATNAAFRTDVAQALGGFRDPGALLLRISGFGARPVRFDPQMRVALTRISSPRVFVPGVGGTSRLRASAATRYHGLSRPARLLFAGLAPVNAVADVATTVRAARREGTADRTFWLALPLVALARASHWLGRADGLLRPASRGGLVPRSSDDLDLLAAGPVARPRPAA